MMIFKAEKIRIRLNQKMDEWIMLRKEYDKLWDRFMNGEIATLEFSRMEASIERKARGLIEEIGIENKDGKMLCELIERIRGEKEFAR